MVSNAPGGTELAEGFGQAAKMLDAGGDVFVLDGWLRCRARRQSWRAFATRRCGCTCLEIGSTSSCRSFRTRPPPGRRLMELAPQAEPTAECRAAMSTNAQALRLRSCCR